MSDISELTKLINGLCSDYSLHIESKSEGNFRIFTDEASGITLFLEIKEPTDFSFYFLERTYDVVYHGDRSDAHVVLSLMFASFLRTLDSGISCSLFDIAHPAVEDEIWGRYIMPEQTPSLLGVSTWKQLKDAVSEIIQAVAFWREVFWRIAGCTCKDCLKKDSIDTTREYELPAEIMNSVKKVFKSSPRINYGNRKRPNWNYLYDIKNEVTIIKSEELSLYLESIQKLNERKLEKVEGIKGTLILDGELKNFLGNRAIKELNKLMKALTHSSIPGNFKIIPLENMIIAVINPYIIGLGRLSGLIEFKLEREILRNRHNRESQLLFPVALFEWQEDICPDQFEGLIKSLLEREPNVKSVRKASPINQGDKGRDLIIEWNVRNSNIISDVQPPTSLIKVVGQCKANNKTVGKNKVLDIRDTVETHNAVGYFLAVSSQVSGPLTEKLEDLQLKGIWTHWWNRDDIEMRLSKNQDLLPQFPKVLKAKHKVKFVDEDI